MRRQLRPTAGKKAWTPKLTDEKLVATLQRQHPEWTRAQVIAFIEQRAK